MLGTSPGEALDFALSDEQELVRQSARELLARESPRPRVRAAIEKRYTLPADKPSGIIDEETG